MASVLDASEIDSVLVGLVYELRPWQWYKQSMLLLGIVFSRRALSLAAWTEVVLAVVSFTAVAGSVYVFNDINDVEADRQHPTKRHRPIASGTVGIRTATGVGGLLFLGGLALAAVLDTELFVVVVAYVVQNLCYTLILKRVVVVDVLSVAVGFVLRAVAGVVVIDVTLSPWLVLCTFLAALVLTLGKRRQELVVADDGESRSVLSDYTAEAVDQMFTSAAAMLLVAYALYTFFRNPDRMMITILFAVYAVFRYVLLVRGPERTAAVDLLRDRGFVVNLLLWSVTVLIILYGVDVALVGVIV
jgi:4-hydroxybenzoate polyprenyltransferase